MHLGVEVAAPWSEVGPVQARILEGFSVHRWQRRVGTRGKASGVWHCGGQDRVEIRRFATSDRVNLGRSGRPRLSRYRARPQSGRGHLSQRSFTRCCQADGRGTGAEAGSSPPPVPPEAVRGRVPRFAHRPTWRPAPRPRSEPPSATPRAHTAADLDRGSAGRRATRRQGGSSEARWPPRARARGSPLEGPPKAPVCRSLTRHANVCSHSVRLRSMRFLSRPTWRSLRSRVEHLAGPRWPHAPLGARLPEGRPRRPPRTLR